jgi:hypothetical protein
LRSGLLNPGLHEIQRKIQFTEQDL